MFIANDQEILVFNIGTKGVDFTRAVTNFKLSVLQHGEYISRIIKTASVDENNSLLLVTN